jgi:hypothetical protein
MKKITIFSIAGHSVILLVILRDFLKAKHEIISRIELKYSSLRISIKDNI